MALIGFLELTLAFILFLVLRVLQGKKTHPSLLTNWPFLGMLPGFLIELRRFYDWNVEVLEATNLTYLFKGPWFCGTDLLFTADPANIHHILSSNFLNYPKGPDFKKIFEVLGDGIFNADFELWRNLRKSAHALLGNQDFQRFTASTSTRLANKRLVPFLDHAADKNMVVDLQDVFQRLSFDATISLVTGHDPHSLSLDMPHVEFAETIDDAEEAILLRHIKPKLLWRLQYILELGIEKRMKRSKDLGDIECEKYISSKREEISKGTHDSATSSSNGPTDLLTYYMNIDTTKYKLLDPNDNTFLKDTILTYILAGRDTTSSGLTWLFWLLARNPKAVAKIRQELDEKLPRTSRNDEEEETPFDVEGLNKLVYLHGALCEALRLYPPVPLQHKSPAKDDVLPSGHKVNADSKIILSFYALGRMRSVWGDDAAEFRPERWISDSGGLKHEPSCKFATFNAGPRTCLGKRVALTQMAIVAIKIIQNYDIKAVDDEHVDVVLSVIIRMRHGFKVLITKRNKDYA